MVDRIEWLHDVHERAEDLLAAPGSDSRMNTMFAPEQLGKWGRDNICGYYWYLHALVAATKPKKVLELGRCLGTSAMFMLGALGEDGRLITVDTVERASDLEPFLNDPRLQVLVGNDLALETYNGIDISDVDFLFIDTDHTCHQATHEWKLYLPFLSPNALVAFDDITMNDMGSFWSGLSCAKLETGTAYHYTGFGLAVP